jgi:hypothetical protein
MNTIPGRFTWNVTPRTLIHASVGYDNTSALQLRAGFLIRWGQPPATPEPPH